MPCTIHITILCKYVGRQTLLTATPPYHSLLPVSPAQ